MDLGWVGKGGKYDNKGKGKGNHDATIECRNCGKKGHKAADCWAKGGGKAADKREPDKCGKCGKLGHKTADCRSGGAAAAAPSKKDVKCFKCGQLGHYKKDCKNKAVNVVEEPAAEPGKSVGSFERGREDRLTAAAAEWNADGGDDLLSFFTIGMVGLAGEILGMGNGDMIECTVDSGAARTVLPTWLGADQPIIPTASSLSGAFYWGAGGEKIYDLGSRVVAICEEGCRFPLMLRGMVADVRKVLICPVDMREYGWSFGIDENGQRLMHKE
jgi:hypothetical protein